MRIYVVRHGQSENNKNRRWSGWFDAPLTEKGKADAQKAAEFLKGISFQKIYASDLSRAVETAQTAIPNCSPEKKFLLREINVGTLANQPISDLSAGQRARLLYEGFGEFGGETQAALYERILQFRKELEMLDCESVAVFTHAGWMCGLLETVLDVRLQRKHICCDNCTVGVFEFQNGIWKLHSWVNFS